MIDYSLIYTALKTLVGVYNENEIVLSDATLNTSDTGLYVNSVPGISLDRIQKSLFVNSDNTTENISDYLNRVKEETIKRVVNNLISNIVTKNNNPSAKSERGLIPRHFNEKTTQNERFVGYWIHLAESDTLKMIIKSLAFSCTKAQIIKIYLYNATTSTTVFSFDLDVSKAYTKVYTSITEQILSFRDSESIANHYLIGYYENNTANPESWQLNSDNQELRTCILDENEVIRDEYKIIPIYINKENLNWNGSGFDCPTIESEDDINTYDNDYNGLSFYFTVDSDYTQQIISRKDLLKHVLQYEFAKALIMNSKNTNAFNNITESIDYKDILNYIEDELKGKSYVNTAGEKSYKKGYYHQLNKEFSNLENDITKNNYIKFM